MILCQCHENWYLSTGINHERDVCWLRAGAKTPSPEEFKPLPPVGAVRYVPVTIDSEMIFYPEIYYRAMRVWPGSRDQYQAEPILRCLAMPGSLDELDSDHFRDLARGIDARSPSEVLMADGWARTGQAEYVMYLHIDELDLIESPPPDGVF